MKQCGPKTFIEERIAEHGPQYAQHLAPAVIEVGDDHFCVETDHPAWAALQKRYAPTAAQRAARDAALAAAQLQQFHQLWDWLHELIDPTPEKMARFRSAIPCGDCRDHWDWMLKKTPPPFHAPPRVWRPWSVERHNQVNLRIGKVEMSYAEVCRMRRWDLEGRSMPV